MSVRRRIEITLTTKQTLVIRSPRPSHSYWCSECARASQMITPDEAAVLSETRAREIYRLIESGGLHFMETDSGLLFICFASLQAVRNALPESA